MNTRTRTARLPPAGLAGLEPTWSRLVTAIDGSGCERTWHVLDTAVAAPRGTIICVHGNPNWSYMWRELARSLTEWRVIAVDALNMGFSERTGAMRRLADHVSDLDAVTRELKVEGPVITVAHDWGGPISMGWAQANIDRVAGIVLMNTGVARPVSTRVPPLISIARSTLRATCETTPAFLHGALRMARPQLKREVYRAYAAPYGSAPQRTGIRDFVEDIPIDESHESYDTLAAVAAGLERLQDVPALLLWGAKDIIFSDAFLHDLMRRLPHADVHRYADAGHQIVEDTTAIDVIRIWLDHDHDHEPGKQTPAELTPAPAERPRIWSAIESRSGDSADAIVEMSAKDSGGVARSISFNELDRRVLATARGLSAAGIKKGDRLATLIPPGIDLTVLVYACLRAGVIVVAPDAALGLGGMRRALRSSRPDYVVGDRRGRLLAKSLRLPATRLSLDDLAHAPASQQLPPEPATSDAAAIVFTSGSTGPSKGVVYTHAQLEAQRDAVTAAFSIEATDKLVVAFAPFSVLAPAIGIRSVIPAMDVTAPAKLEAQALAAAARAIDATVVFASPAVLANIAATADEVDSGGRSALRKIRLVATAGAPVSPQLLAAVDPVFSNAAFATPYGMTEVLPVTLATADEFGSAALPGAVANGVCVGAPLPGVGVAIRPIGAASGSFPEPLAAGTLGEVWVRADHQCGGYDRLWAQQHHAFTNGWHRSGDVGHLDAAGRVWIEGRVDHLIHTAAAVLAPVGIELQAESVAGVAQAAAVGVGPVGTQQLAIVVVGPSIGSAVVAGATVTAAVRAAVTPDVAAVLVAPRMPVDRRHNSKIDRSRVQHWAEAVLSGARPPRL